MGEVVKFQKPVKKGVTLCKEGHHKWVIKHDKQFDSRQGKLVTVYECARCKKTKTKLL